MTPTFYYHHHTATTALSRSVQIAILSVVLCCCWLRATAAYAQTDTTGTTHSGVLKNTQDFEGYGAEEESPTTTTPEIVTPPVIIEQLPIDVSQPAPPTANNKIPRQRKVRTNPNSIEFDIDQILYTIEYQDTVVVQATRLTAVPFKVKEDNKYFYNQAILRVNTKDYKNALVFLHKCIKNDPNNKELLQLRGNAYTELGKFKQAVADFKAVTRIDQTDPVVYYNYATTLSKMGKFDESINQYNQAIRLKPDYLFALQGRASTKTLSEDFEGAQDDYNAILEINPTFTAALRGRGIAKSMLRQYDSAVGDFTRVTELTPTDGLAYYYRGLAYSCMNLMYKACSDYERAAQLRIPQATNELRSCK